MCSYSNLGKYLGKKSTAGCIFIKNLSGALLRQMNSHSPLPRHDVPLLINVLLRQFWPNLLPKLACPFHLTAILNRRGFLRAIPARYQLWLYLVHNIVIQYNGMERASVSALENAFLKYTARVKNWRGKLKLLVQKSLTSVGAPDLQIYRIFTWQPKM